MNEIDKIIELNAGLGYDAAATFVVLKSTGNRPELVDPRRYRYFYYTVIGGELFHTSLQQLKAVNAVFTSMKHLRIDGVEYPVNELYLPKDEKLKVKLPPRIWKNHSSCHRAFITSPILKQVIFGNTREDIYEGLFERLMRKTDLPLKKEWMPYLFEKFTESGNLRNNVFVVASKEGMKFRFEGRRYSLNDLTGYYFEYGEPTSADIQKLLEDGIHEGKISLTPSGACMPEMDLVGGLDGYRMMYGAEFVSNVKNLVKPNYGLKGGVEESFLFGKKRLYKQQGAIVNAVADNFFHKRENTQWLIEQMGSGKSIQAISVIEQTEALRYLSCHPGVTPEQAHSKEGNINYRAIVMAPGHLVKKWKKEIEENVFGSKVKILENLADCEEVRAKGMTRNGKEFYIIGKDLAKLGCSEQPAPEKIKIGRPLEFYCRKCGKDYSLSKAKQMIREGKNCDCADILKGEEVKFHNLNDFKQKSLMNYNPVKGLACPSCGRMMWKDTAAMIPLMPWDMMNKVKANERCCYCGESLWKPLVKNINGKPNASKWHKVSYFKNHTKKDTDTGWVYAGYEETTYLKNQIILDGITDSNPIMVRKWAPARFIKEKLHGFFDFAVFDELHEYKAPGTAQAIAMHAVAKASKQTIGLTGTIAGGYANDLFYTVWRLAPHIMEEMGYTFYGERGEKAFVAKYGTLETRYACSDDGTVNKMSRGAKKGEARTKPGISPDIFGDILMPITVFLDLTDMSNKLPDLHEQVVSVDMDADVKSAYERSLDIIRAAAKGGNFLTSLSSELLLFSLLYPDYPMGYKEKIIDPKNGAEVHIPTVFPADRIYPKEQKMVEIINNELDEGRRCFVYCEYTGTGLPERYKKLICDYTGLDEKEVEILKSESPSAAKREDWIHKKAAAGVKVVITNPKCVETGLDFIFDYEGRVYNYPTLIFAECGTSLFTLWQASRRHFRLNQTEECRTYYLCYKDTNQAKIIRLMAEKQVATSSIQGKFSMEGLQAMAQSVDPRLILMQSLMGAAEDAKGDAEKAAGIFANLNEATGIDESVYGPSITRLYSEVYGEKTETELLDDDEFEIIDGVANVIDDEETNVDSAENAETVIEVTEEPIFNDEIAAFFDDGFYEDEKDIPVVETKTETAVLTVTKEIIKRKRSKKSFADENQLSMFDDILTA